MKCSLAFADKFNHPAAARARRIIDAQGSKFEISVLYDDVLGRRHLHAGVYCQINEQTHVRILKHHRGTRGVYVAAVKGRFNSAPANVSCSFGILVNKVKLASKVVLLSLPSHFTLQSSAELNRRAEFIAHDAQTSCSADTLTADVQCRSAVSDTTPKGD